MPPATDQQRSPAALTTLRREESLAVSAQGGSLSAFGELVTIFQPRLYNFLLRRTRHASDAEELAQETFVRAWERLDRYDSRWRFSTWLFTIAARLAVSHHRRERRMVHVDQHQSEQSYACDPNERMHRSELRSVIWDLAADVLTDTQHTALWLKYAEDASIRDIATILGKSEVTVRVTLFRARESLARHLHPDGRVRSASSSASQVPDWLGSQLEGVTA